MAYFQLTVHSTRIEYLHHKLWQDLTEATLEFLSMNATYFRTIQLMYTP